MSNGEPLDSTLQRLADNRRNDRAWKRLVDRLWPYVLAIAMRRVRGRADLAEDVSQEVFLRLARLCPFDQLQSEEVFRAYLWRVTTNVSTTMLAQQARRGEVPLDPNLYVGTSSPTNEAVVADFFAWLLDGLDDLDRKIMRLTAAGHSLAKIAEHLQITYSNAGVRRHRARQAIRELLRERGLSN